MMIECHRQYEKCKGKAEGTINGGPVCIKCLEWGELHDFIRFKGEYA